MLKKTAKKIFKLKGSSDHIAKGFALGSFIGMLPFPGLQWGIAMLLAAVFKVHKGASVIGVFNTNFSTGLFIFAFNYWLGKKILGLEIDFELPKALDLSYARKIWTAGIDVFLSLLVGGLIMGVLAAFLGYKILKYIIDKRRLKEDDESSDENGQDDIDLAKP